MEIFKIIAIAIVFAVTAYYIPTSVVLPKIFLLIATAEIAVYTVFIENILLAKKTK